MRYLHWFTAFQWLRRSLLTRDLTYLIIFVLLVTEGIDFPKVLFLPARRYRRYSERMLNLFIGQLDGRMDGNHSLLVVVSHLIHCADAQAPLIINIALGLRANVCVMWFISAGPRYKVADISSL